MSIGIRSGVNWIRLKLNSKVWARLLTSKRLGQPGHAHQQRVAAGEQAHRQLLDHVVLTHDHLGQFALELIIESPELVDCANVFVAQVRVGGLRQGRHIGVSGFDYGRRACSVAGSGHGLPNTIS